MCRLVRDIRVMSPLIIHHADHGFYLHLEDDTNLVKGRESFMHSTHRYIKYPNYNQFLASFKQGTFNKCTFHMSLSSSLCEITTLMDLKSLYPHTN